MPASTASTADGEGTVVVRTRSKPRVVVLGTGWGCFAVAKTLDTQGFDVHVVSPRNHMVFTPLLASSCVGTLEFRGIAEPIRSSRPNIHFHLGKCRGINPDDRTIRVVTKPEKPSNAVLTGTVPTTAYDIEYDALVVGVGARSNTFGIPGVQEHVHFLKELSDARGIRKGINECLEAASHDSLTPEERRRLLHFVIVGGGPTGVEFSAELGDFVQQDLGRYYPDLAPDIRITLIEGSAILNSFDAGLRPYAMKRLGKVNVTVRTGANVKDVTPTEIHLSDGETIRYGMCVWSTGVGPRKTTAALDPGVFAKNRQQRLCVDSRLRMFRGDGVHFDEGTGAHTRDPHRDRDEAVFAGMYALGDCADVESGHFAPIAQVAERQGRYIAKELNEMLSEGQDIRTAIPSRPFEYKHTASLAYLGGYTALSDFTQSDFEVARGAKLTGAASWFFWRSAYLSSLGSWRNRLQVPFDWLRTLVFGRDINAF